MSLNRGNRVVHRAALTPSSAVNENDDGALQSFTIGPQGALTGPFDTIATQGGAPAFNAPLAGGQVAVMNVCFLYLQLEARVFTTTVQHRQWHDYSNNGPVAFFKRRVPYHIPGPGLSPTYGRTTR